MKKFILIFIMAFTLFFLFSPTAAAEALPELQQENNELMNNLDDNSKNILNSLDINSGDINSINSLSLQNAGQAFFNIVSESLKAPLKAFAAIVGILIIFSMLTNLKDGLTTDSMQSVLDIVIVLSITGVLVAPIVSLISDASNVISVSSKFMLAYVPIITAVLISSGNILTSGSYYTIMVLACEGISALCGSIIMPLMNVFFAVSISSAVSPTLKLDGLCKSISKAATKILAFAMTLFTAFLTLKTMMSTVTDSVSTRAVRFTLSSFIPIVGSSLSEAYKTVQSSVNLLKTGIGVFVIISLAVVFLPIIIKGILWNIALSLCSGVSSMLTLNTSCRIFESCSTVITLCLTVIFCIMAVFIISAAVLILAGSTI